VSATCAMPKPLKTVRAPIGKALRVGAFKKLRLYEILLHINQSFEQVLYQLQELDELCIGRHQLKRFQVIVEETRAEVNFELVEFLQERELRDWTRFGRLRQGNEERLAPPRNRPARRVVQRKNQNK